jgi:hypothetical protein
MEVDGIQLMITHDSISSPRIDHTSDNIDDFTVCGATVNEIT